MKKPNVLLIMCDQMRHDAIACNGNPVIKTPNLDRLAASGVNFKNSFSPNPICVPARASLTTGCYSHKCNGGVKDNGGEIQEGFPLLGEELNKRGYGTYAMGKLHYIPYMPPGKPRTTYGIKTVELTESGRLLKKYDPEAKLTGVEDYIDYLKQVGWGGYSRGHGLGNNDIYPAASPIPEEYYVDTWVADRTIHYMREHLKEKPDQPFFMWASFPKPHSAYDPPHPYDTMYDPREVPRPIGDISHIKERGLKLLEIEYEQSMWNLLSPEAKQVTKAYYYGLISLQDKQIGRLLDFLEESGIRDDTIVIYTADHGDMLGDFGLYFKRVFYNSSVKVPMMISYPRKIKEGKVSDELVGLQDILPTLMGLIGEPLKQEVDGQDLSPILFENRPVRDYYVSQCNNGSERLPKQCYMITDKRWKYIYHQCNGIEELYDQLNDPDELQNLANSENKEIESRKADMREKLLQWCIDNGDTNMIQNGDLSCICKSKEELSSTIKQSTFGRRLY